jgi:hypothetical protein
MRFKQWQKERPYFMSTTRISSLLKALAFFLAVPYNRHNSSTVPESSHLLLLPQAMRNFKDLQVVQLGETPGWRKRKLLSNMPESHSIQHKSDSFVCCFGRLILTRQYDAYCVSMACPCKERCWGQPFTVDKFCTISSIPCLLSAHLL